MVSQQATAGRRGAASTTRSEKSRPSRYTKEAAQSNLISLVGDGYTIQGALDKVGRSYKAYEQWRSSDPDFKARVDQARALNKSNSHNRERGERMGFADFRRKYLKTETFWHQHQWIDILEGKEPRDIHPSQSYHKGKNSRLLLNVPPFHAKSMTISVDYVVYRLCMDPSFRVIIVSATARLAEDFLFGIKQKLTHPEFLPMQMAYAPEGGWKQTAESWKQGRIVVGANDRDGEEKDPSVQAIGIGGQIYGSRCDLVIVDDAVVGKNVREWEKQIQWLRREVASRIEMGGKLLVVGTRMAPVDLYSELMNEDNYGSGRVPWTHFASPAILEEGTTELASDGRVLGTTHVTLWPYSDRPWQPAGSEDTCDCGEDACSEGVEIDGATRYARWDGVHLEIGPRADNNVAEWALVYQQKAMHGDMCFPEFAVAKATNHARMPGVINEEDPDVRNGGMHGLYVVAGCDPSVKGFAGIVILGFDRDTGQRYLLNAINMKAPKPEELKNEMKRVTEHYGVKEWRVEKTGLLQFFTQDEALRLWFAARGVLFREHLTTGNTKWDPAYGVASCAALFGAYDRIIGSHGEETSDLMQISPPIIELPRHVYGVRSLVQQLVTWTPQLDPAKIPCDLVMALWFAEVCCRELTVRSKSGTVNPLRRFSRQSPRRNQNNHLRINLADYRTGASA